MDLLCEGPVLLVGDGDFSFTLSLMNKLKLKASQVTTSNLETLDSIKQHKLATDNMQALTEIGVQVFLETDARELHTHPVISQVRYQRVIFNFPLADRHNIKRNRALLADFFSSCSQILSDFGQVMVTLCKGQGGTPADQPMRSWHDSWQVHAMASNAGFILRDIVPFEASNYPEYHSVGFRFQDKSFDTDGALTHIFEKADMVVSNDVCARGVVMSGSNRYTCSHYLAMRINRNLLQEGNNPLCLLRKRLESSFSRDLASNIIPDKSNWCILPGHHSRTSIDPRAFVIEEGIVETKLGSKVDGCQSDTHDGSGDALKSVKERKNAENLVTMKRAASLQHGVDRADICLGQKARSLHQCQDEKHLISKFIPENSESVFILIKGNVDSVFPSHEDVDVIVPLDENNIRVSPFLENDQNKDCSREYNLTTDESTQSYCGSDRDVCIDMEVHAADSETLGLDCVRQIKPVPESETNTVNRTVDENIPDCVSRVFHCRTSLLENVSDIYDMYGNKCSSNCQKHLSKNVSSSEISSACCTPLQIAPSEEICRHIEGGLIESQGHFNKANLTKDCDLSKATSADSRCFVLSGHCFLPGPIKPATLAVRHEMMVVHTFPGNTCTSLTQESTLSQPASNLNSPCNASFSAANNFHENGIQLVNGSKNTEHQNHMTHFQNYISEHLIACLQKSELFLQISLSIQDIDSPLEVIQLDGFQSVSHIKLIYMDSTKMLEGVAMQQAQNKGSKFVAGIIFKVSRNSQNMFVSILNLDNIVCQICNISDARLLWSQSWRFTEQFQESSFPQQFTPFSLFPLKFTHDLSFWQTDSDFDVGEMYTIIQSIAGDLVCSVELVDLYTDPTSGQHSRCYRLQFMSHDLVLPYLVSWKLQSLIRMKISQKLGVTLR